MKTGFALLLALTVTATSATAGQRCRSTTMGSTTWTTCEGPTGEDRVPRVPVGQDGLHELPMTTIGDAVGNIGAQFVELFTANKWLRWTVFWFGWFWISPETIIPGAIAVGVGNVFYKERALNLVTIAAAYLGILGYLMLGHMATSGQKQVRLYMGMAGIASLIVLGKRYPTFGVFLLMLLAELMRGGRRGRGRRW